MGVSGKRHVPAALRLGKRLGVNCTGGWVGLRASLDGCGKFPTRTVQPLGNGTIPTVLSWPPASFRQVLKLILQSSHGGRDVEG